MATDSKERRRHTRRATRLAARIAFGQHPAVRAEVLDYSDAGLLVGHLGEAISDSEIAALIGSAIEIRIPLLGRDGSEEADIRGLIAHADAEGIGIEVPELDDEALYSLQLSANDYGRRKAGAGDAQLAPVARTEAVALRERCAAIYEEFLNGLAPDVIRRALDALTQRGLDALDADSRTLYTGSAEVINAQQGTLADGFSARLLRRVKQFSGDADAAGLIRRSSGLELMDDEELDDLLAQTTLIATVEAGIVPQLNEFERRYARLVSQKVTRHSNPFGLEAICQGFRDGIRTLRLPEAARAVIIASLQTSLEARASALYGRLNRALTALRTESLAVVPLGALPGRAGPGGGGGGSGAGAFPALQTAAVSPEAAAAARNPLLAETAQTPGGGLALPELTDDAPVPSGGASAKEGGRLLDVVGRLDDSARALAQGTAAIGAQLAHSKLLEASLGELLHAIDRLSIEQLRGTPGGDGPSVVEQLKTRLLEAADSDQRRLGGAIERTLATTSDLVTRSLANLIPDSPLDSLLRRLERTLLKVSITDPTFPGWPEHPARQVVNLIDQYAMAADDSGRFFDPKLQRNLNVLVDRVCERADQDPRIFEVVRTSLMQDLEGIRLARRNRVQRLQEAMAGRDRIRASRERADEALRRRLAGRRLPRGVLQLFDAGLKHYLVLAAVQSGPAESHWSDTLALIDRLLAWFDPDTPAHEDGNVLLGLLERQLAAVVVDRYELARATASLSELMAAAPAGDQNIVTVPQFAPASAAGGHDLPKAIAGMRIGDWWEFTQGAASVPMQLIWLGHGDNDFTYTNRSATSKQDISAADLVRRIEEGGVRPGSDLDLPVLDRSEFSLLDETYRGLLARATHEHNTGLINRKGFLHRLSQLTATSNAPPSPLQSLCVLEFDQFRLLEQSQGGDATERLASELAAVVRTYAPKDSTVASLRDDAIGVLLPGTALADAEAVVAELLRRLHDYAYDYGGRSYRIGVNIGYLSFLPSDCTGLDALRRADLAAMASRSRGRNTSQAYVSDSPDLLSHTSLADWAGRADALLAGDGLFLRCQRIEPVAAATAAGGALPYYEVLLGLSEHDSVHESPDTQAFITALEELGRAHEVDRWVVQHVFDWLADNAESLEFIGGLAVNLSAQSIARDDFTAWLRDALAQRAAVAHKLVFEITETAAISGYGAAQEFIREIRRFGCRFALDDFGSGYTSYAHLKNLRSDILKIDGSFVRDMVASDSDVAIVKSMNDIAHVLGMKTVAEWVEQPEVLALLADIGIDYAQGYAIERPFALIDLAANILARETEAALASSTATESVAAATVRGIAAPAK